jgi:alpha-tubulin suppressor-like RCC1 family protein
VQVAASHSEACALSRNGEVYCWGAHDPGDIADGTGGPEPRRIEPVWAKRVELVTWADRVVTF